MASPLASNHQTTAEKLNNRGIHFQRKALEKPCDFDQEWQRFAGLCGCGTGATAAWSTLQPIITNSYRGELQFDKALFAGIRTILGTHVQDLNPNLLLLANNTSIGIARQVNRAAQLGFPREYGITTDSIQDHAIVLVDASQNIVDETSLVELKTDAKNCRPFPVQNNKVSSVKLDALHGALGQALIYVAGDLVNCLARRGIAEDDLEVLVVSGKMTNRKDIQRICYVRGNLHISDTCGGRFYFTVRNFEGYDETDHEKHALAAYFFTLSNGIERAQRATTPAVAMCGRTVRIGRSVIPDVELVGSPIPRVSLEHNVTQGEIFRARLADVVPAVGNNLLWMLDRAAVPEARNVQDETSLSAGASGAESDALSHGGENVLVKVSSRAVHNSFVAPGVAFSAIQALFRNAAAREAVSDVFLGAWNPNQYSVVTITKELSSYVPVRPAVCTSLPSLWSGFVELVGRVLIPMAEAGVVHADIRAGWTETANILQLPSEDGAPSAMALIDYESLCTVSHLPEDDTGRTLQLYLDEMVPSEDYTALRYLWWQCIFIAYTWCTQVDVAPGSDWDTFITAFDGNTLDARFWGGLTRDQQQNLRSARGGETNLVAASVTNLLTTLSSMRSLSE